MALSTPTRAYPTAAFILALIGGILIFLGSLAAAIVYAVFGTALASFGFGGLAALLIALAVVALILGILVLVGALMLRSHPEASRTWGILIIVFSLISFIGGGGYYIGAILGLVGGILALVWNPPPAPTGQPGTWAPAAPPPTGQPWSPGQPPANPPAGGGSP